jgi:hypothetical protein
MTAKQGESLLDRALMASHRSDYHGALKLIDEAREKYLELALIQERDQMRRELAASDLATIREAGL